MIDSFSEAEKLLLVFDILPKFSDLIVFTILSSHLGGQYRKFHISEDLRKNINSVCFYDSVVVIEKKKRQTPFHLMKGKASITDYEPKPGLWTKFKNKIPDKSHQTFMRNFRGRK